MKTILDPSFRYVPSHSTDVRKTFERIRQERETGATGSAQRVVHIKGKKAAAIADGPSPIQRAVNSH